MVRRRSSSTILKKILHPRYRGTVLFSSIIIVAVILTITISGSGAFPRMTNPNERANDVYSNELFGLQLVGVSAGGSLSGPQPSATYYPPVKLVNRSGDDYSPNGPYLVPHYQYPGNKNNYDAQNNPQTLTINPNVSSELRLQFRITPTSSRNPVDKTEWVTQTKKFFVWHRLTSFTKISEWFKKYLTEATSISTLRPLNPGSHAIESKNITAGNTVFTLPPIYLVENQFVETGYGWHDGLFVVRTPSVRLTPVRLIADNIFEYSVPVNKLYVVSGSVLEWRPPPGIRIGTWDQSKINEPKRYTPENLRRFMFGFSGARGSQYLMPKEQWLYPTTGPLDDRRWPAETYSKGDLPGPTQWLAIRHQAYADTPVTVQPNILTTAITPSSATTTVGQTQTLVTTVKENGQTVAANKVGYGWNFVDNASAKLGTITADRYQPGKVYFKATLAGTAKIKLITQYNGQTNTTYATVTVQPPSRSTATTTAKLTGFRPTSFTLVLAGSSLNGGFTNLAPPTGAYIQVEFTNSTTKKYTAKQFFGTASGLTIYDYFVGKTIKKVTYYNPSNSPMTLSSTTKL